MRYDSLPQIELGFKKEAASFLKEFSLPVPGESLELEGNLYKPARSNYFFPSEHPKERIVLHFTAGNTKSDILSLTQQDRHVSVAFVVARDGTIYQLFPSKFWSGHLGAGVGNAGTGNSQDKATIGIEISNYGYLVPRDGNLETIYSRLKNTQTGTIGPVDLYTCLDNTAAFFKITEPFREQSFYASFTNEQLDSTIILLRYLTAKYQIPRSFLPDSQRFSTTSEVLNFKGIVTHINYRSSGKWDIGPAFDWARLISGVQAQSFTPSTSQDRGIMPRQTILHSEEEIEQLFPTERAVLPGSEEVGDNEGYNPFDFEQTDLKEIQPPPSGKLFGLLIGINNYDRVRKLRGCVHDVEVVNKYLTSQVNIKNNIVKLLDENASRKAIVGAFEQVLSKAGKNDTVLIYYSGHGTQEEADALWGETDGKLECMVCYDGGTTKASEFLLTDKELRYLVSELYKKTGAHIVTIFDCCHSGDNTRNAALIDAAFSGKEVIKRLVADGSRPSNAFPKRSWNEFVFGSAISENNIKGKEAGEFLPEGIHVQLAACESNQTAVEIDGEGIFTKAMIKILEASGGNISYRTLENRVRQYLRFGYEQTPRIYVAASATGLLSTGFLNLPTDPSTSFAEAIFNETNGWQLNIGAIHGVEKDTKITITDPDHPSVSYPATISTVFVDYANIEFPFSPDKNKVLKAVVTDLMAYKIFLELNNDTGNPKDLEALLEKIQLEGGGHFEFQGKEKTNPQPTDYTLHIRGGEAILTRPADPFRPLVRPWTFVQESDCAPVVEDLRHISRWHFIKQLENKNKPSNFPIEPVQISITRVNANGNQQSLDIKNGIVVLEYEKADDKWKGAIQVQITNNTDQQLYVSAVFLNNVFQSYLKLLPNRVQLLGTKEKTMLEVNGKSTIGFSLDDFVEEYNWQVNTETIKFIVSTEEFNAEAMEMEPLPPPYTLNGDRGGRRGLDITERKLAFSGWSTQTIHLLYKNPVYNIITTEKLQAMLQDEDLAYYASGLYYDLANDENGQPTQLVLKPEIKLPEEQRGLWGDVKIWLANRIESLQRRKLYKKLKNTNRLRIVAEGDSWFQYPILVQDILDHLFRLYAIYNLAEAGDTLENYMKDQQYLEPIGTEQAKFFLVSGGGNDILGEQFRGSLRADPDPGDTTPKRYLNETFFNKLDKLQEWYTEMFSQVINAYPALHILTHSYDYIIPVDTSAEPKRTSWLGKYMIEKNIQPQAEREKLIGYMVDQFNERLQNAVSKFPDKVSYINVRGLVNRNSWYDEIHPTNQGFQLVADKFIAEIERLRNR
jgi:N-acetyl-anhydromuramyl-L-alanine amidase AmpD